MYQNLLALGQELSIGVSYPKLLSVALNFRGGEVRVIGTTEDDPKVACRARHKRDEHQ